jgi:uncharacterized membrane protein YcaP (DUF421 family)
MDSVGAILFRVMATMTMLLFVWWAGGQQQFSESSTLGFAVIVVAATIAGTVIVNPGIELGAALIGLVVLGLIQFLLNWLLKKRLAGPGFSHKPVIVVQDGQIIEDNLRKLRMPITTLLQLLRAKTIFNIAEVELAVMEPVGGLSVLKRSEYQPLTPQQLKLAVEANKILVPVILEGELQEGSLARLGFSAEEIAAFRRQHEKQLHQVFVAFMDQEHNLHVVHPGTCEKKLFLQ